MSSTPSRPVEPPLTCPHCGRTMKSVRLIRTGMRVACAFCKQPFQVGVAPTPAAQAETLPPSAPRVQGAPSAPPQPPGYTVLGELGRGGMGVVYKARDERLKRVVALKVLPDQAGADRTRFTTEAEAVARLHHPNIVQIYEIGEFDNTPYLALEYVGGGTLRDRLRGRPQPARAAARLVETLARAVQHAHERGVLHRDLKPANVLLDAPVSGDGDATDAADSAQLFGSPKITDFGLAKRTESDAGPTRIGDILGTPLYMAPEQARGQHGLVGPAADVYGLGAILYECLTARPPIESTSKNLAELFERIANEPPTPPRRLNPQTPRDLETICLKCLEKDPSRRYGSALALADDLARFLRGEPILERSGRPAGRWTGRLRKALLVLAVALPVSAGWYAYALYASAQAADAARREADAALRKRQGEWALAEARGQARAVKNMLETYARSIGDAVREGELPEKLAWGAGWGFQLSLSDQRAVKIPGPYTFADMFRTRLAKLPKNQQPPLSWEFYSDYRFPNTDHPEPDDWTRKAWDELHDSPPKDGDAHREMIDDAPKTGPRQVRYAEVIRMAADYDRCCKCHNQLNDQYNWWPGKTWAGGDVRAIVSVDYPLEP